jgi:hypothetical protein
VLLWQHTRRRFTLKQPIAPSSWRRSMVSPNFFREFFLLRKLTNNRQNIKKFCIAIFFNSKGEKNHFLQLNFLYNEKLLYYNTACKIWIYFTGQNNEILATAHCFSKIGFFKLMTLTSPTFNSTTSGHSPICDDFGQTVSRGKKI